MQATHPSVTGLILAGGKGTRMQSDLPKVLIPVAGKPLLQRVVDCLKAADINSLCLLIGGDLAAFGSFLGQNPGTTVCLQKKRMGTGDAAASAAGSFVGVKMPSYASGELLRGEPFRSQYLLICAGDTPALDPKTIKDFWQRGVKEDAGLAVLGMDHPQPTGYGRLVRDKAGNLSKIVEERDADISTKAITICNSGVVFGRVDFIFELLQYLRPENAQKEYLLTDCFALAAERGRPAMVYVTKDYRAFDGINDRAQLAQMEAWLAKR